MWLFIYIYMCVCVCLYVYIYIHTHGEGQEFVMWLCLFHSCKQTRELVTVLWILSEDMTVLGHRQRVVFTLGTANGTFFLLACILPPSQQIPRG